MERERGGGKPARVSVVVIAKDEERHIGACLDSIRASRTLPDRVETVVVDNASHDGTGEIAREKGAKVIHSASPYLGHLRNVGAKAATGELIAFIDADCAARPDWIPLGLEAVEQGGAPIVTGPVELPEEASWVERAWLFSGTRAPGPTQTVCGAKLFCTRAAFDAIGGFDDAMTAGEDTEIGKRWVQAGYRIRFEPAIAVTHRGYPTTLRGMIDRQIWHVAGRTGATPVLRDPTVLAGLTCAVLGISALAAMVRQSWLPALVLVAAFATPPALFLGRRIRNAGATLSWGRLGQAYAVSLGYFVGRAIGAFLYFLRVPYQRSYKG